jgi:putative DNA primase/helicase
MRRLGYEESKVLVFEMEEALTCLDSAWRYTVTPATLHLTDYGNAERMIARWGRDLHYCHAWKSWLHWSDSHWKIDGTGEIERLAKETVRHIYAEATEAEEERQRKQIAKHGAKSESDRKIKAMISLAQSEPGMGAT